MIQHPLPFDPGQDEWLKQIADQFQSAMNGDADAFSIIAGYANNVGYWDYWLAQPDGTMGPSNTLASIRNARDAYQACLAVLQNKGATVVGGAGEVQALVLAQPELRAPGDGALEVVGVMPVIKVDGPAQPRGGLTDATTGQGLDEAGAPGNNGVGGDGVVAGGPKPAAAANGNGKTWLWILGGIVLVFVVLKLFRAS